MMMKDLAAISMIAVAGLLATGPALAQTANDAASGSLEEVLVTAQRRSERPQDVPITLTTIDAEQLGQGDVQQLSDIAKLTPGVRFDNTAGFSQPTIRGVGSAIISSGTGSNIGIYMDGFYVPNPMTADFQLLNVKSVQVLKGPQGTLFGRNSTGGAILVTTTEPNVTPSAVVNASYGSYNAQRYQLYATGGLSDRVAVDLSALYREGDGFVRNIATGSDKDAAYDASSVRVGLKAEVTDRFSLVLRYAHAETHDPTTVAANTYEEGGRPFSVGTVIPTALIATDRREVANGSRTDFDSEVDAFQLTATYEFEGATLNSYTQYRDEGGIHYQDSDATSLPIFDLTFEVLDEIFTQEFVISSTPGGPLQWTAGLFYFDDKNDFTNVNGFVAGGPSVLVGNSGTQTRSTAAFIDLTYEVVENWFVTGGLRYSYDKVTDAFYFAGPLQGGGGLTHVPDIDDDRLTPRFVVRHALNDQSSVYASFTRGYKAAVLNVGGFVSDKIDPETITSYEVGYKYAQRGFSLDLSAYHYDYKDLQVASYDNTKSIITNAADSRVNGLEGQVRYEFTHNFEVSAGAAYLDAEYEKFQTSPSFQQCLDFVACGPAFGLFPTAVTDASGFRMQRSPEFTGNLAARYALDLARGRLSLSGTLSYTSKFFFDTSEQTFQDGYELLSLRAEWTDPSERYSVAVFGDNVTDSEYRTIVSPAQFAFTSVWGTPATVGVSLRGKF
jgi:iron complex outermembrane receptor protein